MAESAKAPARETTAKSSLTAAAAREGAAAERERWQKECPDCVRVLISQRDRKSNLARDNWRTQAQEDWLRRNAQKMQGGKGLKVWITPYRENADYNIIWSVGPMGGAVQERMGVDLEVFDIESGKVLFHTWHESAYWEVEHPEETCLQEAIALLRSGRKTGSGYSFPQQEHKWSPTSPWPYSPQ